MNHLRATRNSGRDSRQTLAAVGSTAPMTSPDGSHWMTKLQQMKPCQPQFPHLENRDNSLGHYVIVRTDGQEEVDKMRLVLILQILLIHPLHKTYLVSGL